MKKLPLPIIATTILLILLVSMTWYLYKINQYENIYPEIVGFCLEGIFFVCIINIYQKHQIQKQRSKSKQSLKNTLNHFIKDFIFWLSAPLILDSPTRTNQGAEKKKLGSLEDQIKSALKKLEKGQVIPAGLIEAVRRYGRKESIMLKCMLPVAAKIDETHLKAWFELIRTLDHIVEDNSPDKGQQNSKHFLEKTLEYLELH